MKKKGLKIGEITETMGAHKRLEKESVPQRNLEYYTSTLCWKVGKMCLQFYGLWVFYILLFILALKWYKLLNTQIKLVLTIPNIID